MTVDIQETAGTGFLEINLTGKLDKDDYKQFIPQVEEAIKAHGKLRLLVHMRDFYGFTAGALWEDIKFDARHFSDFDRIAFVGDKKWEAVMSNFCKPFTRAETRFFPEGQLQEARLWLQAP
jgi:hypothetical protein